MFFGPAGVEGFVPERREAVRILGLPPAAEEILEREQLIEIGNLYRQEVVQPPLPP